MPLGVIGLEPVDVQHTRVEPLYDRISPTMAMSAATSKGKTTFVQLQPILLDGVSL